MAFASEWKTAVANAGLKNDFVKGDIEGHIRLYDTMKRPDEGRGSPDHVKPYRKCASELVTKLEGFKRKLEQKKDITKDKHAKVLAVLKKIHTEATTMVKNIDGKYKPDGTAK
jgi:hypothetical protein